MGRDFLIFVELEKQIVLVITVLSEKYIYIFPLF